MTDLRSQLQTTLGAAYTIERELGGGGMSRVFVAEDAALRRQVVVKVLPPEMTGAMSVERFRREIQVAARLQHPHIVPLLSAAHAGDLLYFTMPFVTGESLRTRLVRGELPVHEAVRILREVADALAYAHKQGVVHRDIKPENVLLSGGHALVTDFGVAKAVSTATGAASATSVGIAVGTPAYMSPEQASADPTADHRVDIWAFGVLAYELLVGEPPFRGRTATELIAAVMTQTPDAVAKRRPTVPEALSALIMRCLEKRAADRPQSAEEILHVLDSAVTPGGHVLGYTSGAAAPHLARARASRRWVAAGVILIAALGAFAAWRATRNRGPATDERLVAVLPFRVAGADPSLRYLREGMIDLLAAKLTGSTRVADPRAVLAAWRSAGGTETSDIDPAASVALARRLGARDVLLGDISGTGGNIVLRASLLHVAGGNAREASVEGRQDSISVLVDRLAVQLLALRAGEDARMLGGLAGTPLPAIRDYIEGQALARRGQYEPAIERFRAAIRADSNFAAAGYAFADAAGWLGADADSGYAVAWRARDRLTTAARALLEARIGTHYPVAPTSAQMRRLAERATQVAPENTVAWEYLGEVFYHFAPAEGVPDAHARAIGAFERALELDSSNTSALEHLPDLYYERGDTAAMRAAIEARLDRDTTSQVAGLNMYFAEVLLGDAARGAQWRRRAVKQPAIAWSIAFAVVDLGLPLRAVDSVLTAQVTRSVTDDERASATFALAVVATTRGQPARAARIMRSVPKMLTMRGQAEYKVLETLFAEGDSTLGAESRAVIEPRLASDSVGRYRQSWFAAGLYDLAAGNRETARRAIARLRAVPPARCSPRSPTSCADYALVLDAQLASMERRADARDRLVAMDSMLREGPIQNGDLFQAGNLIASRLWEQAGDGTRALAAIKRRVHFYGFQPAIATYLREEGRLAAANGDRSGAVTAYRRYLALLQDAEPALQSQIQGVRRELARVEREQAGQ